MSDYAEFIQAKAQQNTGVGFEPLWMPSFLFDFQAHLVEWSLRIGRSALFADCGLGKGGMSLAWAENCYRKTGKPSLILAPLAVAQQFETEGRKFGIECVRSTDGSLPHHITVTNYERLHHFNPDKVGAVVSDESGILKNYAGKTRGAIIDFMRTVPYRLLGSATPSPNDHTELGNSAEALGAMKRVEMLGMYFTHDGGDTGRWGLKGHAIDPFWRFVASWARALRRPSDLGFSDRDFVLPPMTIKQAVLPSSPLSGQLFAMPAVTLNEQRQERRETLVPRCEKVAEIAAQSPDHFVAWCSLNAESELLTEVIDGAVEVTGSQDDDEKEELLSAFSRGEFKCLVSKSEIAGFGLNWQHCHRMSFFPSHSHEQFYQAVRRCWRFGQRSPVDVHIVATQAEETILENLKRKEQQSEELFSGIVRHMRDFYVPQQQNLSTHNIKVPAWLKTA